MNAVAKVAALVGVVVVAGMARGYTLPSSATEAALVAAGGVVAFVMIAVPVWALQRWRADRRERRDAQRE